MVVVRPLCINILNINVSSNIVWLMFITVINLPCNYKLIHKYNYLLTHCFSFCLSNITFDLLTSLIFYSL